ncbi:putative AAA-type ATPase [Acanthamoeba polyphaga mimivirus]|nr:putative AAA-type ATPase [Mimivirus reunion]WMV62159.1 putative AAA-type ATPase [Mimivirus sp.]WMV63136.1 putative AAA-type ATPase [Acanthamoeba polyphaga mimivirus]WMV64113.1 putative AAA-type ATPase [Mimivirus sp.]
MSKLVKTTVASSAIAIISYKLGDQIFNLIGNFFTDNLLAKIEIDSSLNPKLFFAIKTELEKFVDSSKLLKINDFGSQIRYELNVGFYKIKTRKHGWIFVNYVDNKFILYKLPKISFFPPQIKKQTNRLKKFIDSVHSISCRPDEMRMCYTSNNNNWSYPIIRRPCKFLDSNLTTEMRSVLKDVDVFMRNEDTYRELGANYRRGMLLYGESGCGKTGLISIISNKYGMDSYILNLNSKDMSDSVLISLASNVKARSILVIEEIDKQIETLNANGNKNVSIGGLLSALDGPQGLAHGVIVIMTANCDNFLPANYMEALIRTGRIDKKFEFRTKINMQIDNLYSQ